MLSILTTLVLSILTTIHINKYKRKFPLPYLNIATKQQEGRHRMYVAGELFGWDTRFPVLVVQDKNNIRVKTEPSLVHIYLSMTAPIAKPTTR